MNIGVILAHFQSEGNEPDAMERLKSLVRLGVIDTAVCLSITADIPSRPVDLVASKVHRRSQTSSSVQSIEAGQVSGSRGTGSLSGGNE